LNAVKYDNIVIEKKEQENNKSQNKNE